MAHAFSWEYALALWLGMFGVGYVIGIGLRSIEKLFETIS